MRYDVAIRPAFAWASQVGNRDSFDETFEEAAYDVLLAGFQAIGDDPLRLVISHIAASVPRYPVVPRLMSEIYDRERRLIAVVLYRVAEFTAPEIAADANLDPLAAAVQTVIYGGLGMTEALAKGDPQPAKAVGAGLHLALVGFLEVLRRNGVEH